MGSSCGVHVQTDPNWTPFEGDTDFHLQVCTMGVGTARSHVKIEYAKGQHTVGFLYGS